jgi:hypothetical protein
MSAFRSVEGRIERRLLLNMRVEAGAVSNVLPAPFRPQTVDGWAIAGVCLIRLTGLRPTGVPGIVGLTSENAAHRIAVEWDDHGQIRTGVWIPQRHTSSRLSVALGGLAFSAVHSLATFEVDDSDDGLSIRVANGGGELVSVTCRPHDGEPAGSVLSTMSNAEAFFRCGSVGFSPSRDRRRHDAVDLSLGGWNLQPLEILDARSSILEHLVPTGAAATWDSAFVMRDLPCRWRDSTADEGISTSPTSHLAGRS